MNFTSLYTSARFPLARAGLASKDTLAGRSMVSTIETCFISRRSYSIPKVCFYNDTGYEVRIRQGMALARTHTNKRSVATIVHRNVQSSQHNDHLVDLVDRSIVTSCMQYSSLNTPPGTTNINNNKVEYSKLSNREGKRELADGSQGSMAQKGARDVEQISEKSKHQVVSEAKTPTDVKASDIIDEPHPLYAEFTPAYSMKPKSYPNYEGPLRSFPKEPPIKVPYKLSQHMNGSEGERGMLSSKRKVDKASQVSPIRGVKHQEDNVLSLTIKKARFVDLRMSAQSSTIVSRILQPENLLYVDVDSTHRPNMYFTEQDYAVHVDTVDILRRGVEIKGQAYAYLGHSRGAAVPHNERKLWFHKGTPEEVWKSVSPRLGMREGLFTDVRERQRRLAMLFTPCYGFSPVLDSEVEIVPDIFHGQYNFTEGNGAISLSMANDLAKACSLRLGENGRTLPPVFQIRYKFFKGTVTVDPDLQGRKIIFTKSMEKIPWESSVPALHPHTQQMVSFDWLGVVEFTQNESFMDTKQARFSAQVGPSMSVLELLKAKGVKLSTLRSVFASEADLPPLVRLIDSHTIHGGSTIEDTPDAALTDVTKLLKCQTSMELVIALHAFTSRHIPIPELPPGEFYDDQPLHRFLQSDTTAQDEHEGTLDWSNLYAAEKAVFNSNRKYSAYLRKSRDAAAQADQAAKERENQPTTEHRGVAQYGDKMKKVRHTLSQNIDRYIHDLDGDDTDEDDSDEEGIAGDSRRGRNSANRKGKQPDLTEKQLSNFTGAHYRDVRRLAQRMGEWRVETGSGCEVFAVPEPQHRNLLAPHQCFLRLTVHGKPRNIVGKVLVWRRPCYHPGDIQMLEAIDIPGLYDHINDTLVVSHEASQKKVKNKFGTTEDEVTPPFAMRASGGDYDGDTFYVAWDQRLINDQPKTYPPARYSDILGIKKPLVPISYPSVMNNVSMSIVHKPGTLHMYWMIEAIHPSRGGAVGETAAAFNELFHRSVNNLYSHADDTRLRLLRQWQNSSPAYDGKAVINELTRNTYVADSTHDYEDSKSTIRHLIWGITHPIESGCMARLLSSAQLKRRYTPEKLMKLCMSWAASQELNTEQTAQVALLCIDHLDLPAMNPKAVVQLLQAANKSELAKLSHAVYSLKSLRGKRAQDTLDCKAWTPMTNVVSQKPPWEE